MDQPGCVLLLLLCATGVRWCDAQYTTEDMVDLSVYLKTNNTLYWPKWPYSYERLLILETEGDGFWAEAYGFKMAIHTGTHLDVPCHVRAQENVGLRIHEVPISRFFGPAAVIDIKEKVDGNRTYRMSMDDLNQWEEKNGKVPDGAIVLVHLGWMKRFANDPEGYWGTTDPTKLEMLSYPSVDPEVSRFLVDERNINAIGTDSGTPDAPGEAGSHLAILGKDRIIIENIASTLELLPPTGYNIHAIPIKLHDTCGAPVRLMAHKTPPSGTSAAAITRAASLAVAVAVMLTAL